MTIVATSVADYLIAAVILVVSVGSFVASRQLNPHWVNRDGVRFFAIARELDHAGEPTGLRRDVHAAVAEDGIDLKFRVGLRARHGRYAVTARHDLDAKRWRYDARPAADDDGATPASLGLHVPRDSSIVAALDRLVAAAPGDTSRDTSRAADTSRATDTDTDTGAGASTSSDRRRAMTADGSQTAEGHGPPTDHGSL